MDVYVCEECGYYYDPEYGDEETGIKPRTPFKAIPRDWTCPGCEGPKKNFYKVDYDEYDNDDE